MAPPALKKVLILRVIQDGGKLLEIRVPNFVEEVVLESKSIGVQVRVESVERDQTLEPFKLGSLEVGSLKIVALLHRFSRCDHHSGHPVRSRQHNAGVNGPAVGIGWGQAFGEKKFDQSSSIGKKLHALKDRRLLDAVSPGCNNQNILLEVGCVAGQEWVGIWCGGKGLERRHLGEHDHKRLKLLRVGNLVALRRYGRLDEVAAMHLLGTAWCQKRDYYQEAAQ